MRGALVGEHRTLIIRPDHPFHHHDHAAGQAVNFGCLLRDHVRQILHRADKMRHPFFHRLQVIRHNPILAARLSIRYTARA